MLQLQKALLNASIVLEMWRNRYAHHTSTPAVKVQDLKMQEFCETSLKKCKFKIGTKNLSNNRQQKDKSSMIRPGSEHESDKPQPACLRRLRNLTNSGPGNLPKFHRILPLPRKPPSNISKDFKKGRILRDFQLLYSQLPLLSAALLSATVTFIDSYSQLLYL